MADPARQQAYLDEMVGKRGYVLDYHKVMVAHDLDFMQAADGVVEAAYLRDRSLDRRTKELIFVVALTVMRASKEHIQSHVRVAKRLGCSDREILEAIEMAFPMAGAVAFQAGFEAWKDEVGAAGIEPTGNQE